MSSTEPSATASLDGLGLTLSLTVSDLSKSLRFYTNGLGFEVEQEHEFEGEVRFIQLRSGAVQIGIGQDDFALGRDRAKGAGLRIWIGTAGDLTGLAERAKAAGITLDHEPEELPWGGRAFAVTDPDGFRLSIAGGG